MTLLEEHPNKIIVCGNGKAFKVARTFTSNTWTFMFYNRSQLTTLDVIIKQQEMANRKNKMG